VMGSELEVAVPALANDESHNSQLDTRDSFFPLRKASAECSGRLWYNLFKFNRNACQNSLSAIRTLAP
jgi:hypothetical protein